MLNASAAAHDDDDDDDHDRLVARLFVLSWYLSGWKECEEKNDHDDNCWVQWVFWRRNDVDNNYKKQPYDEQDNSGVHVGHNEDVKKAGRLRQFITYDDMKVGLWGQQQKQQNDWTEQL